MLILWFEHFGEGFSNCTGATLGMLLMLTMLMGSYANKETVHWGQNRTEISGRLAFVFDIASVTRKTSCANFPKQTCLENKYRNLIFEWFWGTHSEFSIKSDEIHFGVSFSQFRTFLNFSTAIFKDLLSSLIFSGTHIGSTTRMKKRKALGMSCPKKWLMSANQYSRSCLRFNQSQIRTWIRRKSQPISGAYSDG